MNTPLSQLRVDALILSKVLDFLPYPFLVSERRKNTYYNVYVNRKFEEEIGYTVEEMPTIHHWFHKAYPDKEYREEVVRGWRDRINTAGIQGDDYVLMNALIHTKERGDRWYEVKSALFEDVNLVAFINIHDVILKEKELERLNENKNRTLSILSHDLRGPLKNLHTLTRMALGSQLTQEQFQETVRNVNEKTFQVLEFVETTLLWTKSNFDKVKVTYEDVYPAELVRNILVLYELSSSAKNITITNRIDPGIHFTTDRDIVTMVVRNLLSNAIKFTPDNGSITVDLAYREDGFRLEVSDTGIGMEQNTIDLLLNDNYRSREGTRQEKGLGIGLRLCRELLKKVNGTLHITSVPQAGTTVAIALPSMQ